MRTTGRSRLGPLLAAGLPALLPCAGLAAGSAPGNGSPAPAGAITVSAPRLKQPLNQTPAAISVVTRRQMQGQQGLALDESLDRVPGTFFQDRYNFAQDLRISIRGFGARANFGIRGIKILVDGIPATLADGQSQVDGIDMNAIQRIEVMRGPASSLYGNASGGVIRITTRSGPPTPFAAATVKGGSYGFREADVQAGGQFGAWNDFVDASAMRLDGYRDHSRTQNANFNGKFRYDLGPDASLTTVVGLVNSPQAQDPGGLTAAEVRADRRQAAPGNLLYDAGEHVSQQKLGLVYKRSLDPADELSAHGFFVRRDFGNRLPFEHGGQVRFLRHYGGGGLDFTHVGSLLGRPNRVLLGTELERQRDDRQRYDNVLGRRGAMTLNQIETVDNAAGYVQDEYRPGARWNVNLGVRYDSVGFRVQDRYLADGNQSGRRTLGQWSYSAGASYAWHGRQRVYTNVSTSFETPTTTEFANPGPGGGFNPNLGPQEATNYELGLKGYGGGMRYDVSVFHIDVRDELVPYQLPGQPGRDYYVNAGSSARDGLETSLRYRLGAHLTVSGSYTYSAFRFDHFRDSSGNYSGNTIPGIPRQKLFAELAWRAGGSFAVLDALGVSRLYADNANDATSPGYALVNVRFGLSRKAGDFEVRPFLGLGNLLDTRYSQNVRINAFGGRYYEPAPGRNVYLGIKLRTG
ncbi:MAG TPA: TonB-dependent receptor [Gammaproteobacteria bacterium]|nr:TonB-dependent receptor [Gammaproteobacteria bacterium]